MTLCRIHSLGFWLLEVRAFLRCLPAVPRVLSHWLLALFELGTRVPEVLGLLESLLVLGRGVQSTLILCACLWW